MTPSRLLGTCLLATLTLLSLQATAPTVAEARCGPGRIAVWPDASTPLPPRPELIILGDGTRGESVARIADRNPALVSRRGDRVPLVVVELQQGDQRFIQAVLRPERDLRVGDVYELRLNRRVLRDRRGNEARWTVTAMSTAPLSWNAAPTAEPPVSQAFGCGPAESIPVTVDVTTTYPERYRVRVWRDGTDEATARTFDIMPTTPGAVSFGHGMCSGIFDPPSGTRVHFRLSLVGPEGREVPMAGPPLSAVFP